MQSTSFTSASSFQAVAARKNPVARLAAGRTAPRVVCSAQKKVEQVKAAAVSLPLILAASPALALVDDRLGGEGTGKILGVGGIEGWAIIIVFGLVWALFYNAQKQLGDGPPKRGKGDDSGLSL